MPIVVGDGKNCNSNRCITAVVAERYEWAREYFAKSKGPGRMILISAADEDGALMKLRGMELCGYVIIGAVGPSIVRALHDRLRGPHAHILDSRIATREVRLPFPMTPGDGFTMVNPRRSSATAGEEES